MSLPLTDELLLHLATPNRSAAADLSARRVSAGLSMEVFVDGALAPAMRHVGELWESGVWTVTDEHLATAAAEAALSAAARVSSGAGSGPEVVVACVEGDWHSLPSRMLAEVLASQGFAVRFLGASQPRDLLESHLARHRPSAVMLSCSIPLALPALTETVVAVHRLGLPVFAGGRALGRSSTRALALGADGWAASASQALVLLDHPIVRTRRATARPNLSAYYSRQALHAEWSDKAVDQLSRLMPTVSSFPPAVRERTRADLEHLLDCASLSLLTSDPSLLSEQCSWLGSVLAARGVPSEAVRDGLLSLLTTSPSSDMTRAVDELLSAELAYGLAYGLALPEAI